MRSLATYAGAFALALAMAPGVAARKRVFTIGNWTQTAVGEKPMPMDRLWSYYPDTWGTTCPGGNQPCCGDSNNGEQPCGPLNWLPGNGGGNFTRCDPAFGGQQTPINFDINEEGYSGLGKGAGLQLERGICAGHVEPLPGTWEVSMFECDRDGRPGKEVDGFYVTAKGKRYKLWQMHLHGVSEHTVNGAYYPLEAHLVHIPAEEPLNPATISQALVIGVFLSPGAKSFNKIIDIFQHYAANDMEHLWKAIDIYDLLPKNKAYWHYTGSLTTPPCQLPTAGFNVQWYVMKNPVMISPAQTAWFTQYFAGELPLSYLGMNNRPIQPIQPGTTVFSYGKHLN